MEVDGAGTAITTEQCLLNPNRNPHLSREQIEGYLRDFLGAELVLWLKSGIEGDDTDGHIDDIARFVRPGKVVCARQRGAVDANGRVLEENRAILKRASDLGGNSLEVVDLPMPTKVDSKYGRLPASYANFYIGNAAVLVPTFGCREDEEALDLFQDMFPARKVVGIDCTALVQGLGTIHCVTQQVPADIR